MSTLKEIDDFVERASALRDTVQEIVDGKFDKEMENLRTSRERKIMFHEECIARSNEEERIRWWKRSMVKFGVDDSRSGEDKKEDGIMDESGREKQKCNLSIRDRYSSNYSRWSELSYVPNDEATQEEFKLQDREKEKQNHEKFEQANSKFCESVEKDINERVKRDSMQQRKVNGIRTKCKNLVRSGQHHEAFVTYTSLMMLETGDSLAIINPHDTKSARTIFLNMAVCRAAMKDWAGTIEFSNRSLCLATAEKPSAEENGNNNKNKNDGDLVERERERDEFKALYQRARGCLGSGNTTGARVNVTRCQNLAQNRLTGSSNKDNISTLTRNNEGSVVVNEANDALRFCKLLEAQIGLDEVEVILNNAILRSNSSASDGPDRNKTSNSSGQVTIVPDIDLIVLLPKNLTPQSLDHDTHDRVCELARRQIVSVDACVSHLLLTRGLQSNGKNFGHRNSPLLSSLETRFVNKLEKCIFAKTYLRISGYLKKLCLSLSCKFSVTRLEEINCENILDDRSGREQSILAMRVITEVVRRDIRAKDIIVENQSIITALNIIFYIEPAQKEMWRDLSIAACSLVSSSLEMESGVSEKGFKVVCRLKISIVRKLCESLLFWSSKGLKGEESDLLVVMALVNLTNYLISHKKLKHHLFSSQSKTHDCKGNDGLIYALINAIPFTHLSSGSMLKTFAMTTRKKIMESLHNLYLFKDFRPTMLSKMETHILLTTATECKSEIEITRERAITILILALAKPNNNQMHLQKFHNEFSALGGTKMIFSICVSSDDKVASLLIICRALTLLECINKVKIDGNILDLNDHEVQFLCQILKTSVADQSWIKSTNICKDAYNPKIVADIVSLLVRLIAKSKSSAIFESCSVTFMLRLLPTPREEVERKVTAKSICQLPVQPVVGSAHALACLDPTFLCNVLYICLMPGAKVQIERIIKDGANEAIERLVCFLANSGRYSKVSVKNAASILARLVHDPQIRERCRELRGMEILKALFA